MTNEQCEEMLEQNIEYIEKVMFKVTEKNIISKYIFLIKKIEKRYEMEQTVNEFHVLRSIDLLTPNVEELENNIEVYKIYIINLLIEWITIITNNRLGENNNETN